MVADEVCELLTELANCRSVDPSAEEQLITSIVVVTDDLCARVAQRHCRYPGLDWSRDADDLVSLVRETRSPSWPGLPPATGTPWRASPDSSRPCSSVAVPPFVPTLIQSPRPRS